MVCIIRLKYQIFLLGRKKEEEKTILTNKKKKNFYSSSSDTALVSEDSDHTQKVHVTLDT